MRDPGRAVDEGLEITLRARDREVFKYVAARIHDGDHDGGKALAQRERTCHRQEGDRVDPQAPRHEVADNRDKEADHDRHGRRRPDTVRERSVTCSPGRKAEHKPGERDGDQRAADKAFWRDDPHAYQGSQGRSP